MIDIVSVGTDIGLYDSQTPKAANILSVQLGSLDYAAELGIDLRYFLSEDLRFMNSSFQAYLIETLANHGINVSSIAETVAALFSTYNISIVPQETNTGFIAR